MEASFLLLHTSQSPMSGRGPVNPALDCHRRLPLIRWCTVTHAHRTPDEVAWIRSRTAVILFGPGPLEIFPQGPALRHPTGRVGRYNAPPQWCSYGGSRVSITAPPPAATAACAGRWPTPILLLVPETFPPSTLHYGTDSVWPQTGPPTTTAGPLGFGMAQQSQVTACLRQPRRLCRAIVSTHPQRSYRRAWQSTTGWVEDRHPDGFWPSPAFIGPRKTGIITRLRARATVPASASAALEHVRCVVRVTCDAQVTSGCESHSGRMDMYAPIQSVCQSAACFFRLLLHLTTGHTRGKCFTCLSELQLPLNERSETNSEAELKRPEWPVRTSRAWPLPVRATIPPPLLDTRPTPLPVGCVWHRWMLFPCAPLLLWLARHPSITTPRWILLPYSRTVRQLNHRTTAFDRCSGLGVTGHHFWLLFRSIQLGEASGQE